jgi:hypothetical protein
MFLAIASEVRHPRQDIKPAREAIEADLREAVPENGSWVSSPTAFFRGPLLPICTQNTTNIPIMSSRRSKSKHQEEGGSYYLPPPLPPRKPRPRRLPPTILSLYRPALAGPVGGRISSSLAGSGKPMEPSTMLVDDLVSRRGWITSGL